MGNCIVCGSNDKGPLFGKISRCKGCGHIYYGIEHTDEEIERLYSHGYFFGEEYSDYVADRKTASKNFRLRVKVLKRFLDASKHKRLLEIGCAYGFFLEEAKEYFTSVKGIDVSKEAVSYAKDRLFLDVESDEFLKHDYKGQKFDCVCMWDTIEHLKRPDLYIEKIGQLTDKGALLALTTGDIASFSARMMKSKWRLIHPPTHIHYFSEKSLAKLLERGGFRIIYKSHCGFFRSIDMLFNRTVGKIPGLGRLCSFIGKTAIGRVDFYVNLRDIMYLIAKKD